MIEAKYEIHFALYHKPTFSPSINYSERIVSQDKIKLAKDK
jgi:hypothetical protein